MGKKTHELLKQRKDRSVENDKQRLRREREDPRKRTSRLVRGDKEGRGELHGDQDHIPTARRKIERQMKNRMYILINGILSKPSDVNGWTDRAESWIEDKTKYNATKFEYFADMVFRRMWQGNRVSKLQDIIGRIFNDSIYLVGHSNGCDIIERYIRKSNRRIEELHLIAGASESDFRKNGYNDALLKNKVGKIFVYWSKQDAALKQAKWSTKLFGWMGLGYGYIGLIGAKYVSPLIKDRVIEMEFNLDHQDYFSETQLDDTLRRVIGKND